MTRLFVLAGVGFLAGCAAGQGAGTNSADRADVRTPVVPGIGVLLRDSLALLHGTRVGLVTNQTGLTATGETTIDALHSALRTPGPGLVALFSPEHGIRGTEDRANIESGRDQRTGLPFHSLYTTQAIPPPDSLLRDLDVLVVDLFDIGTRTWTYVGTMLYTMRAAARRGIPVLVLDRPNPLGGRVEGPLLDAAIANAEDPRPGRPGLAYALHPAPLRHGLTMGEMARWLNAELGVGADLHVIPMYGWTRTTWWDSTGLPWVRPSPNIPNLTGALLYPALVPFERTNVSVGRGTPLSFQRIGAPWLNAQAVAALLEGRGLGGVRFVAEAFTPEQPTDGKYGGRRIPGVRIEVTARDRVQSARVGAALVWALVRAHRDSFTVTADGFDLRIGSAAVRRALLAGDDPDAVIDRELPAVAAWEQRVRPFLLYR